MRLRVLSSILLLGTACVVRAQEPPDPTAADGAPWDVEIRRGQLHNGLSWFVQRNATPANRAVVRVTIFAGSLVEEEDERGLAHFCEHLAFNGSAHFPPGELEKLFTQRGLRWGAHLNGSTDHDRIEYAFELPTDQPGDIDRLVDVIDDFAGGATLSDEQIELERGVVIAEQRLRRGRQELVVNAHQALVLGDASRHLARDPGGLPEVIAQASAERVRAFYRKWHRADLTGVVVVGDFDPDDVARRLVDRLASKAAVEPRIEIPTWIAQPEEGIRARRVEDPAFSTPRIAIDWLRPGDPPRTSRAATNTERRWTVDEALPGIAEDIAVTVLDDRLDYLARLEDRAFTHADTSSSAYVRALDAIEVSAAWSPGRALDAASRLAREAERLAIHGPCPAELARVVKNARAALAAQEAALARRESATIAGAITDAYRDDGIVVARMDEIRIRRAVLDRLDVAAVRDAFRARLSWKHVVAMSVGPGDVPSDEDVVAALEAAHVSASEPWGCTEEVAAELVPSPPPPGRVVSREPMPSIGAERLTLSNGMRVILKAQATQADRILLAAVNPRALAVLSPGQRNAMTVAPMSALRSGSADHGPEAMGAILAGRVARLGAHASGLTLQLRGASTRADLETELQLVHAALARPSIRPEAFSATRDQVVSQLRDRSDAQAVVMREALRQIGGDLHPRPEDIEACTIDEARAAWTSAAGSSAWTLALVGDLEPASTIPLIERWLASVPLHGDRGLAPWPRIDAIPRRQQRFDVACAREDQSISMLMIGVQPHRGRLDLDALDDLGDVLEARLRALLREQLGESYSVRVGFTAVAPIETAVNMGILFDSAAGSRDRLARLALDEARRLRREPPTSEEVAVVVADRRRSWEENSKSNEGWLNGIIEALQYGRDPGELADEPARFARITAQSIHRTARRHLDPARTMEIHAVASE